tara:strand:+ start:664 stop:969 length:306 start_codon:yes stop_codon:yes gene_type:complete
MNKDYLQSALQTFNTDTPNWYGWKKEDDNGNVIPNNQRMTYENIIIIKDGATLPSKSDVDAKIQELKNEETAVANARISGKAKLKSGDALTDDEITALFGD